MSDVLYSQEESHDFSTWRDGVDLATNAESEWQSVDRLVKVDGQWVPATDMLARH